MKVTPNSNLLAPSAPASQEVAPKKSANFAQFLKDFRFDQIALNPDLTGKPGFTPKDLLDLQLSLYRIGLRVEILGKAAESLSATVRRLEQGV